MNSANGYLFSSAKISSLLGNYVTIRRTRHSGRAPLRGARSGIQWKFNIIIKFFLDPGSRPPLAYLAGMTNCETVLETGSFLFFCDTYIVLVVDIVKAQLPFLENTADPLHVPWGGTGLESILEIGGSWHISCTFDLTCLGSLTRGRRTDA